MPETEIHRNLHPELHPILLQFHRINGSKLESVWRVYYGSFIDKVILVFDKESLVIEAEPYDDTISFHLVRNDQCPKEGWVEASANKPWNNLIGQTFGWGWIAINQQDALDGLLLSFSGIMPQILLTVIASSIKENVITAIE